MIRTFILSMLSFVVIAAGSPAEAGTPQYKVSNEEVEKLSPEMRSVLAGLQYVANAYQIRQFLTLPGDTERREWIERFWQLNDPTPTTPENEMRTEHLIRVGLAREYFPSKKWPGWDRRGEVFIRYGPPDFRGKIWGEVTVRRFYPPGELWYYRRHDMLVSFQQSGAGAEYKYSIDPLGAAENISPDLAEYLLYDTSQSLAKKIPQDLLEFYTAPERDETYRTFGDPIAEANYLMSKPRDLPENIDALMDPDLRYELPKDVSAVFHKDKIREVANNFEITLEDTPSSYPFNFDRRELPFFFGIDRFRSGQTANRVDLQIEVPVSGGESFEETYHVQAVLWDSQLKEVARSKRDVVVRSAPGVTEWENLLPSQLVFSVGSGYYRLAVSVHGDKSGRESSYRTSFSSESFGPQLALSDILFARRIAPAEESSIFTRGALEVVPHAYHVYSRSFPIPLYFEIYNLTLDPRGVASFKIEYKIVPQSDGKKSFWERFRDTRTVVASEFESSAYAPDEPQSISVRTDNLAKGSYELLVTVTDNLSKQVTYRKGTFSIVD
jgi:GWxTD domain-containing protein